MRRLRFLFALSVLLMPLSAWGAFNQGTGGGGSVDISDVTGLGSGVLSPLQTQAGIVGGFPTIGSTANGDCVEWGASGTLVSTGSACGSGGGSGTVSNGTIGQLAQYAATGTTVSGLTLGSGVLAALQANVGSSASIGSFVARPASNWVYPVTSFHASGLNTTTLGSINSGSPTLSTFQIANGLRNGVPVAIVGAGAAGAPLVTTISSGAGTATLTLAANASTTVTNAVVTTVGSITAGSHSLNVASTGSFAVGNGITVAGAGTAGAVLLSSITGIASGVITIADAAVTTVTNAHINFDDTVALNAALATGRNVFADGGNAITTGINALGQYNVTGPLNMTVAQWFQCDGLGDFENGGTAIINRGTTNNVFQMTSAGATLRDCAIRQAVDIVPSAGYGIQAGSGTPSFLITNGAIEHNHIINMFGGLDINDGLSFWSIAFNQIDESDGTTNSTVGITVNNPEPAGDIGWLKNSITCDSGAPLLGVNIIATDTDGWVDTKITGCDPGLVLNTANANNQSFVGTRIEGNFGAQVNPLIEVGSGASNLLFTGGWFAGDNGKSALRISGTSDHISFGPNMFNATNFTGSPILQTGTGTDISEIGNNNTVGGTTNILNSPTVQTGNLFLIGSPVASNPAAILTTGTCHGSAATSGGTAGEFTAPACTAGTIIISGLPASNNGYSCDAHDNTTPTNTVLPIANTPNSATFRATTTNGDQITYHCWGF